MRNKTPRALAVAAGCTLLLGAGILSGCRQESTRDPNIPPPVDAPVPPMPAGAQTGGGVAPGDGPAGGLPPGGGPAGGMPPGGPGG